MCNTVGDQMEFYDSMEMQPQMLLNLEDIMTKLMAERKKLIMGHYGDPNSRQKEIG